MARILVIDDDPAVRSIVRRSLELRGHVVLDAGDGGAGLRLFRESPADLVVTDIYMPDQDGIETIQSLRAEQPGVRILAISGGVARTSSESALLDAELLGADATLAKPFGVAELQDAVDALLQARGP